MLKREQKLTLHRNWSDSRLPVITSELIAEMFTARNKSSPIHFHSHSALKPHAGWLFGKWVIALIMNACPCCNRPWWIKLTLTAFMASSALCVTFSKSGFCLLIHYSTGNLHPSLIEWAKKRSIKSYIQLLDHISFAKLTAQNKRCGLIASCNNFNSQNTKNIRQKNSFLTVWASWKITAPE